MLTFISDSRLYRLKTGYFSILSEMDMSPLFILKTCVLIVAEKILKAMKIMEDE